MGDSRVLLLLTGGTLTMRPGEAGVLQATEFSEALRQSLPELDEVAQIDVESLMVKDSSDLAPADWTHLAEAIRSHYNAYDGFVVVHGTDTMAYTASAISFMLPSCSKPVIFTGSQRPLREPRSDARINLVDSVTAATLPLPEVAICLHSVLLRGNRSRKQSTTAYTAFESPNFPPLATLGLNIELSSDVLQPRGVPGLPLPRPLPLDEKVSMVFMTPTTRARNVELLVRNGARGLVLLAYGAGNIPAHTGIPEVVKASGVPALVLTQCFHGGVSLGLYEGGQALVLAGAIDGGDMTPEAALTKLMTGLGVELGEPDLRQYLLSSVAGERRPG